MLKDITIGQYLPGESFLHKLDPRTKIIADIIVHCQQFLGTRRYAGVVIGGCADFQDTVEIFLPRD